MNERSILEQLVGEGRVMQVATLTPAGEPWQCHVWYTARFDPDELLFMSSVEREHSRHIAANASVSAAIVHDIPGQLGDPVRGVVAKGEASIVEGSGLDTAYAAILSRWPNASRFGTVEEIRDATSNSRVYRIQVRDWALHDEVTFADSPRHDLPGRR